MRRRRAVPVHNLKVTKKGKVKKRSAFWRMRRAFYLGFLALTVGAAGLIYVVGQVELPVDPSVAPEQEQTSFICAADVQTDCNDANAMAQLHGTEDRVIVTYDQIPVVLRQAVLSAEDKDFFEHGGVDPVGIARAAVADLRGSGVRQGGSTITQQYVKQEYLSSEQTATRKIKEAVMAVKLEQKISKEEILTRYLNTVYFGRGAYGVQAASRSWFDHDVETLSAGEAAFLAGLLRNPNGADPYRGPDSLEEAARRRTVVLTAMEKEGYLSEADVTLFESQKMDPEAPGVAPQDRFIKPAPKASTLGESVKGSEVGSEYYAEKVRQWLVDEFTADVVYTGGLKVYTTLDLGMQKAAFDAVTSTLDREGDPSGALVAIDDQGRVKAMMGGTDFSNSKFNLATDGVGRQPGSTFKAFALAEAIREGFSIESVLPSPTSIELDDPTCRNADGTAYPVKGGPGGSSSLVTATKGSINTVYAQLMSRLGPDKVVAMANELGITRKLPAVCSLVLGSGEVSVQDMASAYSTFANQGIAKSPILVTKVEFPDGRVIDYAPTEKQVLTPDQASRVTFSLQQVIEGGTGKAANFGRPAAGKTGTTQLNADAWFVGYTPKLTAAVWMGYPQGQVPMSDVHGIEVQGGTFPAEIWKKFMEAATADTEATSFPELDSEELAAGTTLDDTYGTTSIVAGGTSQNGVTATTAPPPTTAKPRTTKPPATSAPTTAPATTAPATTAPATTAPATTAPAEGAAGAAGGATVGANGKKSDG